MSQLPDKPLSAALPGATLEEGIVQKPDKRIDTEEIEELWLKRGKPQQDIGTYADANPGTYRRVASVNEVFADYKQAAEGNVPTVHAHIDPRKPARKVIHVLDAKIQEARDRLEHLQDLRRRLSLLDLTVDEIKEVME